MLLFFLIAIHGLFATEPIHLILEHAKTEEEKALGLMGRQSIADNWGMLFHYPHPQILRFWMYNTLIDLDLAYLDDRQVIREIHTLKAHPNESSPLFFHKYSVPSQKPMQYALEVRKGWFKNHGIDVGDCLMWKANRGWIYKKPARLPKQPSGPFEEVDCSELRS